MCCGSFHRAIRPSWPPRVIHRRQRFRKEALDERSEKVRTRSKALQFILDRVPEGKVESICVLHSGADDLDEFLDRLRPMVPGAEIAVGHIGPVVGVHVGPRAVGLTWIEREG